MLNNMFKMPLVITPESISDWDTASIVTVFAAVIAAGVSLLGLVIQSVWNKKKLDAGLKAQSRINWIQVVRVLVSELLLILEKFNDNCNWTLEEIEEFVSEAKNKINLIELYLGPDTIGNDHVNIENPKENKGKNNLIYIKLENLRLKLDSVIFNIQTDNGVANELNKNLIYNMDRFLNSGENPTIYEEAEIIKNIFRIYFKIEWNKAKSGK